MVGVISPERQFHVLLVEDNLAEARLAQEALKEGKLSHSVDHVSNGDDALAYLRREGPYRDSPCPDLILLDLNLPRRSGHDVLRTVKSDEWLRRIPVVILTTSSHEDDIRLAYQNNANCYITKPIDLDQFIDSLKMVSSFWFNLVQLPPNGLPDSPMPTPPVSDP